MPRGLLPALAVTLALTATGCPLSPQTQAELDQAKAEVAAIEKVLKATESAGGDTATIKAQLLEAQKNLTETQAKATNERISTGAENTEGIAKALEPLAGVFFPPALIALGIIGNAAGAVKRKYKRKDAA